MELPAVAVPTFNISYGEDIEDGNIAETHALYRSADSGAEGIPTASVMRIFQPKRSYIKEKFLTAAIAVSFLVIVALQYLWVPSRVPDHSWVLDVPVSPDADAYTSSTAYLSPEVPTDAGALPLVAALAAEVQMLRASLEVKQHPTPHSPHTSDSAAHTLTESRIPVRSPEIASVHTPTVESETVVSGSAHASTIIAIGSGQDNPATDASASLTGSTTFPGSSSQNSASIRAGPLTPAEDTMCTQELLCTTSPATGTTPTIVDDANMSARAFTLTLPPDSAAMTSTGTSSGAGRDALGDASTSFLPAEAVPTLTFTSSVPLLENDLVARRAYEGARMREYRHAWVKDQMNEQIRYNSPAGTRPEDNGKYHDASPFQKSDFSESQVPGPTPTIPTLRPAATPYPFPSTPSDPSVASRRDFISGMISHAWRGYADSCFGQDELMPLSGDCHDWLGMGITIVDSLSTLWMAGLREEFDRAAEWVHTSLDVLRYRGDISFFETTIRIVGGLVSAYDLTGDPRFIHKAMYVANSLHVAYGDTGLPRSRVDLHTWAVGDYQWAKNAHILAEVGTVQLEYITLSKVFQELYRANTGISGNFLSTTHYVPNTADMPDLWSDSSSNSILMDTEKAAIHASLVSSPPVDINDANVFYSPLHNHGYTHYGALAHGVFDILNKMEKPMGLYPFLITTTSPPRFANNRVTIGGLGDSYYEYLLKLWILTGRKHNMYREMYVEAMHAVSKHQYGEVSGTGYIGTWQGNLEHEMDHLSCFSGGLLALGVYTGAVTDPIEAARHMRMATQVTRTCAYSYISSPTGLGPEAFRITEAGEIEATNPAYYQRPETVESLFILWRVTKDPIYREWGWLIAQSIEQNCRQLRGYTTLTDTRVSEAWSDRQETFLLAETLKYLFLLFSDDEALDLTQWVFNTEAHPIRVRDIDMPSDAAVAAARRWVQQRNSMLKNLRTGPI